MSNSSNRDEFGRAVAKIAVAQILESAGFHGAQRSAVDALVDVVLRYISHLGRASALAANLAGRSSCNVFDILQALEETGFSQGFPGASDVHHCLVGSGTVKELATYVNSQEAVPFACAMPPKFPVPRAPPLTPSFAESEKESGGKHVPDWLPTFPDPHTYVRTEVWNANGTENEAGAVENKEKKVEELEHARQRRKAAKSLAKLHERMMLAAGAEVSPAVNVDVEKEKKEVVVVGNGNGSSGNPFLAPPLAYDEKGVSCIDDLPEEEEGQGGIRRRKVSVLEAFAPVVEAVEKGQFDGRMNGAGVLLNDRAPVNLRIGVHKKSIVAALSSRDARTDLWFPRDDGRDDKKRRAEMIFREAMENPQELTQL